MIYRLDIKLFKHQSQNVVADYLTSKQLSLFGYVYILGLFINDKFYGVNRLTFNLDDSTIGIIAIRISGGTACKCLNPGKTVS